MTQTVRSGRRKGLLRFRRGGQSGAEERFLAHLELIERAAQSAGRRAGFSPQDVEEFISEVKLKLIEDDYAVVRKHRGDSRMSTYLVTVVNNLCRDFRNHLWGKYRPSAKAKELGTAAVVLESLLVRDGQELEAAIEMAKERLDVPKSRQELHQLAGQLPARVRRQFVGETALEGQPADSSTAPERRANEAEFAATSQRVEQVLDQSLRALDPEDFLILKMHLADGRTLSSIARDLGLDQRPLYSRRDRSIRRLRQGFEDSSLTWEQVREILGWRDCELRSVLTADGRGHPENGGAQSSNVVEQLPETSS